MTEQHNPEYRAGCVNGDLYGYAEIAPAGDGFEVTLYADFRSLAVAAGYGREDEFPRTDSFHDESAAHRFARDYADALVEQAKAAWRDEHGEVDDGDYFVQATDGAHLNF